MLAPSAFGPLFRNRAYSRIWTVGLLTGVVRWLELLTFGLYAHDITGSPFLVALLVVLRFLPLALCGVLLGAVSDLVSPRRLMIAGLVGMGLFSATLAALFRWGDAGYTAVALAALVSGVFWAGDLPVRRRMIGEAVDDDLLAGAMALDGAASNGMRLVGPLAGGALYQGLGITGVFALNAVLYAGAAAVALAVAVDGPPAGTGRAGTALLRPLRGAAEALAHALRDGDVLRILLVTVVFNVWGFPYLSMIPVIGRETLGLSAGAIGALTAVEGLFALAGAVAVVRLRPRARLRGLYLGATAGLLAAVLVMGAFPGLAVTAVAIAAGGACTAVFAAMQSTLIYVTAPPAMRGRFLGLMTLCIGAGVLGFANIGLTADAVGASRALWIVALEGLIPLAAIGWTWREMRQGG